jgi:hypothetical protein
MTPTIGPETFSSPPPENPPHVESTVTFVPRATSTTAPEKKETTEESISTQTGCRPEPVTSNTPTGIAGCEKWGSGIASHYGPGSGVAMNFCTWTYRIKHGCGAVRITSAQTGITVTAPVVDFCDCYFTTKDERIIDLQWGVLGALGLDQSQGLYKVEVWPTAN